MGKIVHFEIPAKNTNKAIKFYEKLFGWRFKKVEKEKYWFVETGNKEITLGLEKLKPPNKTPLAYVLVDSIEESLKQARKQGGKVLISKTKFHDLGFYAVILDPSGNSVGLWERK